MKNVMKFLAALTVFSLIFISCDDEEDLAAPKVGDTQAKYIRETSAFLEAELVSEGDEYVTEKGIVWGTASEPTIDDNGLETEDSDDLYTVEIEDLSAGTTYYARAYAMSDAGTSYGTEVTFETTSPVTDIEGNAYSTVKMGDQVWMAENLRTTTYSDGTAIPNVTNEDTWSELTTPAYAWYENNSSNSDRGAYYNYYTVATGNLCPDGWHVATETEWQTLLDYLGSEPGRKLKFHGEQLYTDYNETGFSAGMEGYRASGNGVFARYGEWTWFWIGGADASQGYTYAKKFEDDSHGVEHDLNSNQMGFSVRCMLD